ncbi:unnamed protein product, partial [Ectocarpus sp. 13 AM-2016]
MDRIEGGRASPQDSKLLSGHGGAERGEETGEPPSGEDDQVKFDPTPASPAVGDRAPATVELYPSYIRPPPVADDGGQQQEGQERETERGYEGGDRVRLLVGSFNVGNSPLTDLDPWLPYGGKGFDLIVVGLQESTYRPPRGARDSSPFQRTLSLSPSNSLSPIKTGGGGGGGGGATGGSSRSPLRWGTMQSGDPDDDTPPPGAGLLASSSPSMSAETPPAPPLSSPPPPSSGFLHRKRRGSISGGVGPGMAAAASATRGGIFGEAQQRRRASVSSFEDMAGAAARSLRLKSPRGGGGGGGGCGDGVGRRSGRLGQSLVGGSKEQEGEGGRV